MTAKDVMDVVGGFFEFVLKLVFAVVIAVAIFVGWGVGIEPGQIEVKQAKVESDGWRAALPQLRIVVLSDLHIGSPHIDLAKLEQIVAATNAQNPDLVLLLGDFLPSDYFGADIPPAVFGPVLGELKAKFGVMAVLGEKDWGERGGALRSALAKAEIRVLQNQAAPIRLAKGKRAWIVGLADWAAPSGPDYAKAARKIPKGEPVLVLVHNPARITDIPSNVVGVFAGHTLGGLINVPTYGGLVMPDGVPARFARGLVEENGVKMFISAGIGTAAYPIRFNTPPEITVVTVSSTAK